MQFIFIYFCLKQINLKFFKFKRISNLNDNIRTNLKNSEVAQRIACLAHNQKVG